MRDYWEPLVAPGPNGQPVVIDTHHCKVLELRCECGHVWTMPKADFPGRRKLKACGRPQCPFTTHPRVQRQPEQRGVSMSIYVSMDNLLWLQAYAGKHRTSVSKYIDAMVSKLRADELAQGE